ncbi:MAG: hypothetical protein WBZ36_10810 [Candidatus Nitrosopolaris sp.]
MLMRLGYFTWKYVDPANHITLQMTLSFFSYAAEDFDFEPLFANDFILGVSIYLNSAKKNARHDRKNKDD